MKFLAILRDSLREAIDAKVFYVMIGLSSLLILLALSCTFRPRPGGAMLMQMATVPLIVDLKDLNLSGEQDPEQIVGQFFRRFHGGVYQVVKVEPTNGAPDLPDSTFLVRLSAKITPLAGAAAKDPEQHIRQHFGQIDQWRVAEVIDVRRVEVSPDKPEPGAGKMQGGQRNPGLIERGLAWLGNVVNRQITEEFEVTARVTRAGRRFWPYDFSLFFGFLPLFNTPPGSQGEAGRPGDIPLGVPLGLQLFVLENYIVSGIGAWVAILVSVVLSAFFIPNMLRKGTVDLLLVKPISRITLLLYKYVGGLVFILVNTAVAVIGVWMALGVRSGIWAPAFLITVLIITFFFAILYSVSTLFGVLTRSPVVAILLTCFVWLFLFVVGVTQGLIETERKRDNLNRLHAGGPLLAGIIGVQAAPQSSGPFLALPLLSGTIQHNIRRRGPGPEFDGGNFGPPDTSLLTRPVSWTNGFTKAVAVLHYILPRTRDLDNLTTHLVLSDLVFSGKIGGQFFAPTPISWGGTLTVSGLFISLMLALSCWRFAIRDY
jgi:ABC-2 family transporter protein